MGLLIAYGLLTVLSFVIAIFPFVLLIKVLKDSSVNNKSRVFWTIMLIPFNYIGVIMYLFIPNKNIFK